MSKKKKRLLWAAIALLLFLPPCYYLKSSFFDRKAQLQRESLLVRKGIIKPLERAEQEGEEVAPDLKGEASTPFPTEEAREARRRALEAEIRKLEQELLAKEKGIEDWKHRWEEKNRELKRYKRELMALRKEAALRERKLSAKRPPVGEGKRAKPEEQEKRGVPPLRVATCAECQGVPMSHRKLTLLLCEGLHLGSNLGYHQAVMVLRGLGISPRAGWNQADPSFPMGADELEEVLSGSEKAISGGLVSADYPELTDRLRQYCRIERANMVVEPRCEGPMVTQCTGYEIPQCDFAIYLCKVLGIGEDLKCDQCFSVLTALGISPKGGWRIEEPYVLITQREIEEVRCSVREAYMQGLIAMDLPTVVSWLNDYCLWLKTNIRVVGEPSVAETVAQTDYQGGGGISIPKGGELGGGEVGSASQ
jgi:hypothetical protein